MNLSDRRIDTPTVNIIYTMKFHDGYYGNIDECSEGNHALRLFRTCPNENGLVMACLCVKATELDCVAKMMIRRNGDPTMREIIMFRPLFRWLGYQYLHFTRSKDGRVKVINI